MLSKTHTSQLVIILLYCNLSLSMNIYVLLLWSRQQVKRPVLNTLHLMYTDQIYTNFKPAIFLVLFTRKQYIFCAIQTDIKKKKSLSAFSSSILTNNFNLPPVFVQLPCRLFLHLHSQQLWSTPARNHEPSNHRSITRFQVSIRGKLPSNTRLISI